MNAWTVSVPRKAKAALASVAFVALFAVVFALHPFGAWAEQSSGVYLKSRGEDALYETLAAALADAEDGDVAYLRAGNTRFGDEPFAMKEKSVVVSGEGPDASRVTFSPDAALTIEDAGLTLANATFALDEAHARSGAGLPSSDADALVVVRGLSTFELDEGAVIEGPYAPKRVDGAASGSSQSEPAGPASEGAVSSDAETAAHDAEAGSEGHARAAGEQGPSAEQDGNAPDAGVSGAGAEAVLDGAAAPRGAASAASDAPIASAASSAPAFSSAARRAFSPAPAAYNGISGAKKLSSAIVAPAPRPVASDAQAGTAAAPDAAAPGTAAADAALRPAALRAVRVEENAEFVMKDASRIVGFDIRIHPFETALAEGEPAGLGAAAYIGAGATFIMEGGDIERCIADKGGALYVEGSATLAGGTIRACEAQVGAAAYVTATGVLDEWGVAFEGCISHREPGDVYREASDDDGSDEGAETEGAFDPEPLALGLKNASVCRIVGGSAYSSLDAAVKAVGRNATATIEMLVSADVVKKTIRVDNGKRITIKTAPNVSVCALTMGASQTAGAPVFEVLGGASLTLDGTRSTPQGASGNGIVVQGRDSVKAEDAPTGKRGFDVRNGSLTLKSVTVRRFAASFGGTAGVRSVGINAYKAQVSLEGTTLIRDCKLTRRSSVKEDSGGITAYGDGNAGSNTPTHLFMGPDVVVSDCTGVTGGVALAQRATADIRGTITRCASTTGVSHRGGAGLYISTFAEAALNGAVITNNRFEVATPNVTPSAGGIWLEDGKLDIHGATIKGNRTNSTNQSNSNAAGGVGMNIESLAADPDHTRLALSGKVVIKDNYIKGGSIQANLTLARGGIDYMHYLMIDGDLEPGSYVGITAQASGNKRYLANEAFAASALTSTGAPAQDPYQNHRKYTGDAKVLANLNCLVNDRNPSLRGSASPAGWKSPGWPNANGQAGRTLPPEPAAIIWAPTYTLDVKKTVVDANGSASGTFTFEGVSKTSGISGMVYEGNGTPTGQVVTLSRKKKDFTLASGQYVRFNNVANLGGSQSSLGGVTIREKGSVAASTGNPDAAFVCRVTAKAGSVNYGSTAAASDGSAQWSGGGTALPSNTNKVTVTFSNTLRTGPLVVEKRVLGDYADATKAFLFTLTIHTPSFVRPDASFIAREYDAQGAATGATYSLSADTPLSFHLRSGHTVKFDALPVGTTYDLSEQGAAGYFSSAEVSKASAGSNPLSAAVSEGQEGEGVAFSYGTSAPGVANAKIAYAPAASQANKVLVTNRMMSAPPTDVDEFRSDGYAALIGASAAAIALLAAAGIVRRIRRRRSNGF